MPSAGKDLIGDEIRFALERIARTSNEERGMFPARPFRLAFGALAAASTSALESRPGHAHHLSPNRALRLKDGSHLRALLETALAGYRRLGERSLPGFLGFCCESVHGNCPFGLSPFWRP